MEFNILLASILIICIITDIQNRKIYNMVVFPALIIALIMHLILGGWQALGYSLLGFMTGFLILLVPYLMGGMGAGDVKLLALIGCIKGAFFVLNTAIYMAIIGAFIALIIIMFRKGILQRLKAIGYYISGMKLGIRIPIWITRKAQQSTYPYGVAIVLGAVMSLIGNGWF